MNHISQKTFEGFGCSSNAGRAGDSLLLAFCHLVAGAISVYGPGFFPLGSGSRGQISTPETRKFSLWFYFFLIGDPPGTKRLLNVLCPVGIDYLDRKLIMASLRSCSVEGNGQYCQKVDCLPKICAADSICLSLLVFSFHAIIFTARCT